MLKQWSRGQTKAKLPMWTPVWLCHKLESAALESADCSVKVRSNHLELPRSQDWSQGKTNEPSRRMWVHPSEGRPPGEDGEWMAKRKPHRKGMNTAWNEMFQKLTWRPHAPLQAAAVQTFGYIICNSLNPSYPFAICHTQQQLVYQLNGKRLSAGQLVAMLGLLGCLAVARPLECRIRHQFFINIAIASAIACQCKKLFKVLSKVLGKGDKSVASAQQFQH